MADHTHMTQIKNPGPLKVSSGLKTTFFVLMAVGAASFLLGLKTDPNRAWAAFLQNHFFFLSLALGGGFFAAIQFLTSAMWSAPIRRVSESLTAYIPFIAISFAILYFGIHTLYIWSDPSVVKGDIMLEHKAGYLNVNFFLIRNFIAIAVWFFLAKKMVGNSLAQDKNSDPAYTAKNRALGPIYIIIFAVSFTMAVFDGLMSIDPHWFTTMFGVYLFAGLFYSTLAAVCIITILLKRAGYLAGIVNENHLHDLGKFMFAFTVFWAYIGFSQFMLIWYANMPEETYWYLNRFHGGWLYVSLFLLIGKFMTPFFLLIRREDKRRESRLMGVAIFMLVAQWIDVMWIVQPQFFKENPVFGITEIGVTAGFLGVFGFMVTRFLSKNSVVAIGDPRLAESVHHHHQ